jgi:hypothetical protein
MATDPSLDFVHLSTQLYKVGHYWVAVVETENNQEVLVYDSLIGSSCVAARK